MPGVGERLLASKLQILRGTNNRRTSVALSILTGRLADRSAALDHLSVIEEVEPASVAVPHRAVRQFAARTVYLSQAHLADIDHIVEVWQQVDARRLTRSAVLRRAVELLRETVEADLAKSMLESE